MIRVCLVEDQNLVREGLESLLHITDDIRVISHAGDGQEALAVISKTSPDIVLLDLRMPRMDGLTLLRTLANQGKLPLCIVLTTFDDDVSVLEALKLGAKGYLLKDVTLERLTHAIRTVASGGTLISPAVTERLLRGIQATARPSWNAAYGIEKLTERELEILRLMTGGLSNSEIASALGVAEGTVKNHVSSILGKLGVRDRIRAVLRAIETGCV